MCVNVCVAASAQVSSYVCVCVCVANLHKCMWVFMMCVKHVSSVCV